MAVTINSRAALSPEVLEDTARLTFPVSQVISPRAINLSSVFSGTYQPLDADLTSIAALGFTATAFLKKTAANTWALDTNSYLLGNQTITLSGDVSGSGATAITATLATVNANVGSFGSSTAIPNFTVNGKGLITAAGTSAVVAPAGTLTGATLAAGVTASSLTSLGTIASLVATTVDINGGTVDGAVIGGASAAAGTFTALTSTGNTILGDASTDTLNVGNGGIIKDASGNVGIGVTPSTNLDVLGYAVAAPSLTANNGILRVRSATSNELQIGANSASPYEVWFQTKQTNNSGATFPLTLNPLGGNVGIGKTPSYGLHMLETMEFVGNPSYINVRAFTTPQAAIDRAIATGMRRVYFPAGTYTITAALTTSGKMTLFGDGPGLSIINLNGAVNGIEHIGEVNAYGTDKLEVLRMGFKATASGAKAAIKGVFRRMTAGYYIQSPTFHIADVEVGTSDGTYVFTHGAQLYNACFGTIESLRVDGYTSGGGAVAGSYGIWLSGGDTNTAWVTATSYVLDNQVVSGGLVYWCIVAHTSGTFATDLAAGKWIQANCVDVKVRDCMINYVENGIYGHNLEGLHCQRNTILSVKDGIVLDTNLTNGKPYADISGNHVNCSRIGIYVREMTQFILAQNLVYCTKSLPFSTTFTEGIRIESGNLPALHINSIVADNIAICVEDTGTYSGNKYAYALYGNSSCTESVTYKGNKSENFDTALIYLDSNASGAIVQDDNTSTTGETWSNNGTGNLMPFGTYTPGSGGIAAIANTTNIAASTPYACQWSRSGRAITVSGKFDADATAAGACEIGFPLPVPSNFTAAEQLGGSGAVVAGGFATTEFLQISADLTNDRAKIQWNATLTANNSYSFIFHYLVW